MWGNTSTPPELTHLRGHAFVKPTLKLKGSVGGCRSDDDIFCLQGKFHIENKTVDWTIPEVPVLPYGDYRLNVHVGAPATLSTRKQFFCLHLEGLAYPRV